MNHQAAPNFGCIPTLPIAGCFARIRRLPSYGIHAFMGLTKLNSVTEQLVKVDIDRHPIFAKLWASDAVMRVTSDNLAAFRETPGLAVLALVDDPVRFKETFDMAVIAPEIKKLFGATLSEFGFTDPSVGRRIASSMGIHRLPAIAVFRYGEMMGAIEGLRAWREYEEELVKILTSDAAPKKTIAINAS